MIGGWDCLSTGYLRYLLNLNRGKDVHVAFCSLGGYVKDGLEMNQLFKDHGSWQGTCACVRNEREHFHHSNAGMQDHRHC